MICGAAIDKPPHLYWHASGAKRFGFSNARALTITCSCDLLRHRWPFGGALASPRGADQAPPKNSARRARLFFVPRVRRTEGLRCGTEPKTKQDSWVCRLGPGLQYQARAERFSG